MTAVDRAYVRGRRVGFRQGQRAELQRLRGRLAVLGGFQRWRRGAAYIVMGARDGRGIAARSGPLVRGVRYQLCRDGRRVCVTRPPD